MRIFKTKPDFISFWYNNYSLLLSLLVSGLLYYRLKSSGICIIILSNNMSSALDAVMTFTSIVLGFVGVLLTTIVGIKKESKIVKYFFDNADKKDFSRVVKREICAGLCTAILSIALYFPVEISSLFEEKTIVILFLLWIVLLFYFAFSTYRLMSLLLSMLFSAEDSRADTGKTLGEEARRKMEQDNARTSGDN